jgi:anti-anti-sigma factor
MSARWTARSLIAREEAAIYEQYAAARITVTTTAEAAVVTVTGEIDSTATERLGTQLALEIALGPRALLLDLTDVTFCSAQGLSVLITAKGDAHEAAIPCAIVTDRHALLRPIELLRLDRVLRVHHTFGDALDWLATQARQVTSESFVDNRA